MPTKPSRLHRAKRAFANALDKPRLLARIISSILRYAGKALPYGATILAFAILFRPETLQRIQVLDEDAIVYGSLGLALLAALRVIACLFDFLFYYIESHPIDFAATVASSAPLESTKRFVEAHHIDRLAIGSAIEVFCHPYLDKRLEDNGWDPSSIRIIDTKARLSGITVDATLPVLTPSASGSENNPKYTLAKYETPFTDASESLSLFVARTDWHTVQNARALLSADETLRHKKVDFTLQNNQTPSSLCLHFVCLTRDNKFLALRRNHATAYYPNALSISFEEQFSHEDMIMGEDRRAEVWFQRSLCEEVFPASGLYHADPRAAWDAVSQYVEFKRIWSCILEEDIGNFSLVGVCRLALESGELVETFRALELKYNCRRDDEGRLCIMDKAEVDALLRTGHSTCRKLYFPAADPETVSAVHPTSLYRASLVSACL